MAHDDDDDFRKQLEEQAAFLGSGKPGAATAVRGAAPPIGKRAALKPLAPLGGKDVVDLGAAVAQLGSLNPNVKKTPALPQPSDDDVDEERCPVVDPVLSEVKEREHRRPTAPIAGGPRGSQSGGVTRAMHRSHQPERTRNQLARAPRPASDVPAGSGAAGAGRGHESAGIHEENSQRLGKMGAQELLEAQRELRESLDPALQEKLRWLGARRKAQAADPWQAGPARPAA